MRSKTPVSSSAGASTMETPPTHLSGKICSINVFDTQQGRRRFLAAGFRNRHHERVHHRHSEERAIEAVEHAAVSGQHRAAVLHAGAALEGGFGKIADLSRRI